MRLNIRRILEDLGHTVIAEGTNTFECVKHMERSGKDIDIVLLDIIMPRAQGYIDGVDAIEHIKKMDHDMPIIVLTCDAKQQTVLNAIKAGATDYVLKPVSAQKIQDSIDYISKYVNISRSKEAPQAQDESEQEQNEDTQSQTTQEADSSNGEQKQDDNTNQPQNQPEK